MPQLTNAEQAPHIAAIRASLEAGFRFLHLPEYEGGPVGAIHAERERLGAVETYILRAIDQAIAARFHVEDYLCGKPVWQRNGSVAEVVTELLTLPPRGSPGAPSRNVTASSDLWLPGSALLIMARRRGHGATCS